MDGIKIRECPSCNQTHQGVTLQDYATPQHPWTHWFTCDTTGDPVPLTLRQREGGLHHVSQGIVDQIVEAEATGHWMVCVYRMDGGLQHLRRTTSDFPTSEFQNSIELLSKDIAKETGPPAQEPLQAAEIVPRPVELFGNTVNE